MRNTIGYAGALLALSSGSAYSQTMTGDPSVMAAAARARSQTYSLGVPSRYFGQVPYGWPVSLGFGSFSAVSVNIGNVFVAPGGQAPQSVVTHINGNVVVIAR